MKIEKKVRFPNRISSPLDKCKVTCQALVYGLGLIIVCFVSDLEVKDKKFSFDWVHLKKKKALLVTKEKV